jgi:hypothetical protein
MWKIFTEVQLRHTYLHTVVSTAESTLIGCILHVVQSGHGSNFVAQKE